MGRPREGGHDGVDVPVGQERPVLSRRKSASDKVRSAGAPDVWSSVGALEAVVVSLRCHLSLLMDAPLITRVVGGSWLSTKRARASAALRQMIASAGGGWDPKDYVVHSGTIGRAITIAARGASLMKVQKAGIWKYQMYERDNGRVQRLNRTRCVSLPCRQQSKYVR